MPRTVNIGGVDTELWLYAGDRVTTATNEDVDNAALVFAAVNADGTVGSALVARVNDETAAAFTPTTNQAGIPPKYLLPTDVAWVSANGGVDWDLVATAEQAELRSRLAAIEAQVEDVETTAGAQDKADLAQSQANIYTDGQVEDVVRFAGGATGRFWVASPTEVAPGAAQGVADGDFLVVA